MRKYVVVAAVVAAIGVAAGLYMVTDTPEMTKSEPVASLAAAADAPIDLTKVDIEAEYTKGNRSFQIISALVDKRVAQGGREPAIKLLEEYVAANPKDSRGHKRLLEQYQLNGRMEDYNKALLALTNEDPTEENLLLLSYVYNAAKDYQKQAEVLRKIIDVTGGKKPEVYVDLATVQRLMGEKDAALKTTEELKAKHPSFNSNSLTYLMVSALTEKGEIDRAYQIAQDWINTPFTAPVNAVEGAAPTNPRPQELADLCNILHYSGHADKAIALVEQHLDMLESSSALVVAYANADVTAGREDHAFGLLQKIDEAGRMSPVLYPTYLDLAMKRNDIPAADAIANKLDASSFTEEQALNILELSRISNAPSVYKTLLSRFDAPQALEDKPVLAAVLSILKKDPGQDKKIEEALATELTSTQRTRLAESCARAQKTACFDAIVKQFPAMDAMNAQQVVEYSQLYLIANRPADIVDAVGARATGANSSADIQAAHRRLAAAAGKLDVLKPWLDANAATAPINSLQELFYLANNNHQKDVASDVAERLYARDPSPANSDILTNALVAAGDVERALPLLRAQVKDASANDGLYVATLAKFAPKNPELRKELADYAEASLRSERGNNQQLLNYAYIMINNGRKDAVIPYAKKYADARGGDWKKLYSQLIVKPVKASANATVPGKLSREQLIEMSRAKNISDANKRQIAYSLLSDGHKNDALAIFADLAQNKGPDSQEVKDLMYMWGGKLSNEQLAWVNARATNASPYDKARWAELINNTASDESVLRYVSSTPDALYNRPLRQKYFRILATSGNRQNYDEAMRGWVAQTTDVPALNDYASTAQAYSFSAAAANAYARVLQLDPNNKKALSQTATMQYSKGKFTEAGKSLDQYLAVQAQQPQVDPGEESDPELAHYFKAELLRRKGDKAGSEAEFRKVAEMITASGTRSPTTLSRLYTVQFRLGQHEAAKSGFEQLLTQYPDDKSILADYMSALIEYRYINEATRVANRYDKTSPYYGKGVSLEGKLPNISSSTQSPNNLKEATHMDWIDTATVNHATFHFSEKPGYVTYYTPVAQEVIQVAANAAPTYSPEIEFQRQQQLRLQLLYAQIEQNSGQIEKAKERVAILKKYYPNDPQLMSYEASLASVSGNTAQAINILKQVQIASPENEDIPVLISNLKRANLSTVSNFVKLDHSFRGIGDHREQISTLTGAAQASDHVEIGFNGQNDFIKTKGTRRASDGAIGDYDYTRQNGEVYAAYNFNSGERLQGSLFANNKTTGIGTYLGFSSDLGRTELLGEYRRPYWGFVEAAAEHATRDRIGIKHFANPTKNTSLGFETSINNYNIDGMNDLRKTSLIRASVIQQLQEQTPTQPYLAIGYGFDGEYKMGTPKTRLDALSNEYFPLPLYNHEIHALTGIYQNDLDSITHLRLLGGAAFDRFNRTVSPLVDGRIARDVNDQWQIGAHGRYAMETSNTDNRLFDVGADITYKF